MSLTFRRNVFKEKLLIYRLCAIPACHSYSTRATREDDVVILRSATGHSASRPILTEPLKAGQGKNVKVYKNRIPHEEIIGKHVRGVVGENGKWPYRIHEPTLDEYVKLTPRMVTPIYSADANLMISLLQLHPPSPGEECTTEIFEAGTGHGGLTLHLARAVYGFSQSRKNGVDNSSTESDAKPLIHTLDTSPHHSAHARKIFDQFRRGVYSRLAQFHVGTIPDYISTRLSTEKLPFLSHAILDLPAPHTYLDIISKALRMNGLVMVFCPSITQIITCLQTVKKEQIPLWLESVIEVGTSVGVGGKEWDVRPVKPRAILKAEAASKMEEMTTDTDSSESSSIEESTTSIEAGDESMINTNKNVSVGDSGTKEAESSDSGWEMVCRPKVGSLIVGGGFIGLFRKKDLVDEDKV